MRIWLSRPHMGGDEMELVEEAFASGYVAPAGPMLARFEAAVADYLGGGVHCAALASGTAALHLAFRIKGIGPGDEVWTSSMTFAGGAFPIAYEGAAPVFFDLSPESWTMDPALVAEALEAAAKAGRLPKAVVPTDLYGQPADSVAIAAECAKYGVACIVDAAESLGAACRGAKAGSIGDAAVLSFNGNKIITTSGGGMLVSRDAQLVEKARFLATQARDPAPHYQHSEIGFNYRLSNVLAAIGVGQMRVLDARVARRREIFARYEADFRDIAGLSLMPEPDWARATRWLTAIRIDPAAFGADREAVRKALLAREIESRPLWKPMNLQPIFAGARHVGRGLDAALFADGLCLPSGSDMTDAEQDEVIATVIACGRAGG